jgi:WD repeat and SOF domain-containing protein 1
MVRVHTISRSRLEWTKDRDAELPRAHRNYDPVQNPMARQVEYVRAVRSAKLDRMFAKPFVGALSGHQDSVLTIATDPTNVGTILTGAVDGEVAVWDVQTRTLRRHWTAHRHAVVGSVFTPDGVAMLTASRDRTVKLWDTDICAPAAGRAGAGGGGDDDDDDVGADADGGLGAAAEPNPLCEYLGASPFTSIDHHWQQPLFVTGGAALQLWDINRTQPLQSFNWGDDPLSCVRMNRVEVHLAACAQQDRGIVVYDTRSRAAHSKLVLEMRCASLAWNPMNPNMMVAGCDDWNCYTFDLRVPGRPRNVFQGHAAPINDVDFSPTGEHFVAGSADQTVRLWSLHQLTKSNSLELFHTKRMAKVHAVRYSLDARFLFTGSEDAVVRVWKADASRPIRPLRGAEESQFNYMRTLRDRYAEFPEVKRIGSQRNTPKSLRRKLRLKRRIQKNELIKEMSRKKNSALPPLTRRKLVQRIE